MYMLHVHVSMLTQIHKECFQILIKLLNNKEENKEEYLFQFVHIYYKKQRKNIHVIFKLKII